MTDLLIRTLRRCLVRQLSLTSYKGDGTLRFRTFSQATLPKRSEPLPENKSSTKQNETMARSTLQKLLNIKEIEAFKLVMSHQKLAQTDSSLLSHNYNLCVTNGLNIKIVINNPFLLYEKKLEQKLAFLSMIPINLSSSIPLAKLTLYRLKTYTVKYNDVEYKIKQLCQLFNINEKKVCDILAKTPFLLTKDIQEDIGRWLNIFYEHGLSKNDILRDMWIFKYSDSFLTNRLLFIKNNNIVNMKTWMIRCPEETLFKHIQRECENRNILGENSVAEYLSKKLVCKETIAKIIIRKHPQLQNKSLLKIDEMINLLFKQGYSSIEICRTPKILLHSINTTAERLKQLNNLGKTSGILYVLILSQKLYQQYIDNLVKQNAKSDSE